MDLTLEINTENKYNKNKIQQKVPTSKEYSQLLSASSKPENN